MMRTRYLLLSGMWALLAASCSEDKGNYDYREINEVRIGQMADVTKYTNIDVLAINPEVSYTLNPGGEYEYEWSVRSLGSPVDGDPNPDIVIGNELKLEYPVTLPTGKYAVRLKVKDAESELIWSSRFDLTVASATYMGWVALCDENGRARLDMAEESGDQPLYSHDILARYLPDKKGPDKIYIYSLDMGSKYDILVSTADGCNRLSPEDLSWNEQEDFPYLMADPNVEDMIVQAIGWYPLTGDFLIGDNDAYFRSSRMGGALFSLPVNFINGKQVKLAPYVGYSVGTWFGNNFITFDQDNRKFVNCSVGGSEVICSYLEDFPQGKELVFMQNTSNSISYAVLRNPSDGKYSFFSFNASRLTASGEMTMDVPNVETVKAFAFDPYNNYMFFTDGQKLFLYNWSANDPSKKLTTIDLLNGEKITMLKYKPGEAGRYEDNLLVATADAGGTGKLYLLDVQANREVTIAKEYAGGFGTIVDVAYRNR